MPLLPRLTAFNQAFPQIQLQVDADLALPGFLESFRLQEVSANPGGLLLWPAKLLIPAGFILLLLQAVSEIIKRIAFLLGRIDDPLEKHVQPTAEENLIAELKRREDATPKGAAA